MELKLFEPAIEMADVEVEMPTGRKKLWRDSGLSSYPNLLGDNALIGWEYLLRCYTRFPMISHFFALQHDFETSLSTYSALMNLAELASDSKKLSAIPNLTAEGIRCDWFPSFARMEPAIAATAVRRTFNDRKTVERIRERVGADREAMLKIWPMWKSVIERCTHRNGWSYRDVELGELA